jgi:AP endonuclease-1
LNVFSHLHFRCSCRLGFHKRSFLVCNLRHSYTSLLTSGTSWTATNKPLTTRIMAKKISNASSDSSLSPPPDNLVSATETAAVPQPVVNGKKRKAETTSRTKRTGAQQADVEDAVDGIGESPRPKRRATKKLKVTEEVEDGVVAQESGDGEGKPKPKPKPRAKVKGGTAKILPPLAKRTENSKHLIGAHVSAAGG